jgi:hypothetical protein
MGEISNEEFIATPYIKDGWFHCNYDGTHTITIEVGRTQEGGD